MINKLPIRLYYEVNLLRQFGIAGHIGLNCEEAEGNALDDRARPPAAVLTLCAGPISGWR
jgi:hypothetical protein